MTKALDLKLTYVPPYLKNEDVFASPKRLYKKYIKKIICRELSLNYQSCTGKAFCVEENMNLEESNLWVNTDGGVFNINYPIEDWYRNVYKRGLSRIMGCFVESIEYTPNGKIYARVFNLITDGQTAFSLSPPQKVLIKGTPGNYWFIPV